VAGGAGCAVLCCAAVPCMRWCSSPRRPVGGGWAVRTLLYCAVWTHAAWGSGLVPWCCLPPPVCPPASLASSSRAACTHHQHHATHAPR
jgi:hypothetical protein